MEMKGRETERDRERERWRERGGERKLQRNRERCIVYVLLSHAKTLCLLHTHTHTHTHSHTLTVSDRGVLPLRDVEQRWKDRSTQIPQIEIGRASCRERV